MKSLYMPFYRIAVSYVVSVGRRWSILEHLLLAEVASTRRTVAELSLLSDMPDRLIIEAMINLMRAGWVEVRSTEAGVYFAATTAGKRHAGEPDLPVSLQRVVKWASLCVDRLTGCWFRAEDLELVYERDLPDHANVLDPLLYTYEPNDGAIRDLLHLNSDEALEPSLPQFRTPSKPYARVGIAFGKLSSGLPQPVPLRLSYALLKAAEIFPDSADLDQARADTSAASVLYDEIKDEDVVVGGTQQLDLLKSCLEKANSTIIIHSCFVSPDTIQRLLPDLERAARRKVRVELLWGLHTDPEQLLPHKPISDSEKILDQLPPAVRSRVQLSPISSGSHAKVIMYDEIQTDVWITVIGSCNFLSTNFDWIETSVRSRSQRLASQMLGRLIAAQLPASGSWSPLARRLNRIWPMLRHKAHGQIESGPHKLSLLVDDDHYACVTIARDFAKESIFISCDLYGLSAETSVLVPMATAAEGGCNVNLLYNRPSKLLRDEAREPQPSVILERKIKIDKMSSLHAKFLIWDDDAAAVTSFNWMSTVVSGARARGAEFGLLIEGPGIANVLRKKFEVVSAQSAK